MSGTGLGGFHVGRETGPGAGRDRHVFCEYGGQKVPQVKKFEQVQVGVT